MRRPDRKDLLAYLKGETQAPASIDKSARLEMPVQVKRTANDDMESSSKKARYDDLQSQKIRENLAAKLDAPQEDKLAIDRANLK